MKILLIVCSLFLVSCEYNPQDIKYNDKVKVVSGFYKGESGIVDSETIWITPCQHKFLVNLGPPLYLQRISVCDLDKI